MEEGLQEEEEEEHLRNVIGDELGFFERNRIFDFWCVDFENRDWEGER